MLTRRHFIAASSAAFAANLFAAPKDSQTPSPDLEKLGSIALNESKKYKATYCDIRIVRLRDQRVGLRLPQNAVQVRLRPSRTSARTRASGSEFAS